MSSGPLRLLFVCGGNTCRSPMAAAVARTMLPADIEIESAGVAAWGASATDDAIHVVRNQLGLDLSNHRPRSVDSLRLNRFDRLFALDSVVSRELLSRQGVAQDKILTWQVDDPFGLGQDAYVKCLSELRLRMEGLAESLHRTNTQDKELSPSLRVAKAGMVAFPRQLSLLEESKRQQLLCDLDRWEEEFKELDPRESHAVGIVVKTMSKLESILRTELRAWFDELAINYESEFRGKMRGKQLERLTLGEVVEIYGEISTGIERYWSTRGRDCRGEESINEGVRTLRRINDLRKALHGSNVETAFAENRQDFLVGVRKVLSSPLIIS